MLTISERMQSTEVNCSTTNNTQVGKNTIGKEKTVMV